MDSYPIKVVNNLTRKRRSLHDVVMFLLFIFNSYFLIGFLIEDINVILSYKLSTFCQKYFLVKVFSCIISMNKLYHRLFQKTLCCKVFQKFNCVQKLCSNCISVSNGVFRTKRQIMSRYRLFEGKKFLPNFSWYFRRSSVYLKISVFY